MSDATSDDKTDIAGEEYERALQAVAAAAAVCRQQLEATDDPISDALTILHGIVRVRCPGQDVAEIAELACLSVVVGALCRDGAAAVDGFNTVVAANGLPWRLVRVKPVAAEAAA